MYYDRFSEKNELILLGHMCNIKVSSADFQNFIYFIASKNIRASMTCTKIENYYYVSFFSKTVEKSEEVFEILLTWNP